MAQPKIRSSFPGGCQTSFFSIDPGKTTGWALFKEGKVAEFGVWEGEKEIWDGISAMGFVRVWVIENYRIRPGKYGSRHRWQSPLELQIIGAMRYLANRKGIKFVLQEPAEKEAAKGMLGGSLPRSNIHNHAMDAIYHGFVYLRKVEGGSFTEESIRVD